MWICPKCGERVEDSFDVCWSCGTTSEGEEDPAFLTADQAGPLRDAPRRAKAPASLEPPLQLIEGYRAYDVAEAQFLVDRLAERGIPAVVQGTRMSLTEYPVYIFAPKVMVRAEDLPRAQKFFEDFERRKRLRTQKTTD